MESSLVTRCWMPTRLFLRRRVEMLNPAQETATARQAPAGGHGGTAALQVKDTKLICYQDDTTVIAGTSVSNR